MSTTLQPYRRTTAPLTPPASQQATVQLSNRPRQPIPLAWLQDVLLFAIFNRKETYCMGTGTPQQALCRSNHGLGDGGNFLPAWDGPMADVWSPFNVSAITVVPAAFVNLTSPGRPNAIGLQDPAWGRCFDPSRPQFDCATLKPLASTNDQWDAFAGG